LEIIAWFQRQTLEIIDWFQAHQVIMAWLFSLSVVLFIATLIGMPLIIARMPTDYFASRRPPAGSWRGQHPVMRFSFLGIKNLLGLILFVAGVAMLVLPGQGIITMFVAITLLDFPGKRRLELRIMRQRHVSQAVNWFRKRAGRPPLLLPEPSKRAGRRARRGADE
jgi:hypothetical protein